MKAYLITYYPTDLKYLEEHNSYSFQGTQEVELIDYDSSFINLRIANCVEIFYCDWGGTTHSAGENCTAGYIWSIFSCGGAGSGGTSNNPSNFSPINTSTNFVTKEHAQEIITEFGNLDFPTQQWLNNPDNFFAVRSINTYLDNNDYSDEAKNLMASVIAIMRADDSLNFEDVTTLIIDSFDTPKIEDIVEELECFDLSAPARMTVYCEQSISGSREITGNIGHTFIGLEQNGVVRNIGFYPDIPAATLVGSQDSELHDNSNSPSHVSISVDISAIQLQQTITYMTNYPPSYSLNSYNCTDFGIVVAGLGGLSLPQTIGEYSAYGGLVKFKGRNPSDLGEDMRELTLPTGVNASRNLLNENAPLRSADCQ